MARRETSLRISAEGRDQGKVFLLKEMSAFAGESWATRAFLALARSGTEIPEDLEAAGWAGIASMGLKAFAGLTYEEAAPLLSEMLDCVHIVEEALTRPLTEDDVEEIATIVQLRREVFLLHVDFSKVVALLKSQKATTDQTQSDTPTSPELSESSSPAD